MKRVRSTHLTVGDDVEVQVGDIWFKGKVSRSVARGAIIDVRIAEGRVMTNLTSKNVRKVNETSK